MKRVWLTTSRWLGLVYLFFFFSSRRRHTRFDCDWSSDVCSSDLALRRGGNLADDLSRLQPRLKADQVGVIEVVGVIGLRSEERRVGKECRSRWSLDN